VVTVNTASLRPPPGGGKPGALTLPNTIKALQVNFFHFSIKEDTKKYKRNVFLFNKFFQFKKKGKNNNLFLANFFTLIIKLREIEKEKFTLKKVEKT
jgi:hypothetical protein